MINYEDDRPFEIPEHLKNLTPEQLHARVEELLAKIEKERTANNPPPLGA
ncbi:MAG: hypothetical protein LBL98_06205 [Ruminococcus sp.]|jgi:hypothetical protein|nr:hypothetical protein [Ruminococcus sp.]